MTPALKALRGEDLRIFSIGDKVETLAGVRGTIVQRDARAEGFLYLLEFQVWPGEPLRREWQSADVLRTAEERKAADVAVQAAQFQEAAE